MSRVCPSCQYELDRSDFSNNQWRKGNGNSVCRDCIEGNSAPDYQCDICDRVFNCANDLRMHSQVHRPRNVTCPLCGDERFRSGANVASHVESGYCRGCFGKENARRTIYKFVSTRPEAQQFLVDAPRIENGRNNYQSDPPQYPYRCSECNMNYRNISQLMQHQDNKHNVRGALRIGYY